jgi:hypothetical protein
MFTFSASFDQKLALAKKLRQQKTRHIFQLSKVCQRSVTHFRAAHAAHHAITIEAGVCCVRVCNFSSLACIVLAIASILKIL